MTPLLLLGLAYGAGIIKLWHRTKAGRNAAAWKTGAYLFGWVFLAVALVLPIHELGEQIFTVHMIEHEVIMAVSAPLLVLARPAATFLWALPRRGRLGVASAIRQQAQRGVWTFLTTPRISTTLHGLTIWIWHMPILFDSAVSHRL